MNEQLILILAKQRLGQTGGVRDEYLQHIIKSTIDNLTKIRGLELDPERSDHTFLVVRYVVWEYENKERGQAGMPDWLRRDLNNLMMKAEG